MGVQARGQGPAASLGSSYYHQTIKLSLWQARGQQLKTVTALCAQLQVPECGGRKWLN